MCEVTYRRSYLVMVTGKTVAVGKVVDVPPAGSPTF